MLVTLRRIKRAIRSRLNPAGGATGGASIAPATSTAASTQPTRPRPRVAAASSAVRASRPTRARTILFPGTALDLGELRSQVTAEKGGALLTLLQERSLDLPGMLETPWPDLNETTALRIAEQNLRGGRRRDLPLTPQEAREVVAQVVALTLDFDPEPGQFLARLFDTLGRRSLLLAPRSRDESLILIEAFQAVGAYGEAAYLIADVYGRYDFDGDREMMCLEANNALYRARAGEIGAGAADTIRRGAIGELFGKLAPPDLSHGLSIDAIETPAPLVRGHQPLATIILTVYNGERTLPYALASILAQTWRKIEVIAVDDASTDGTGAILRRAAAQDPRIKLVRSERSLGAFGARNLALRHATGDTVTCHDADDWSHPQKIERQMRLLCTNPKVVACSSGWIRVTADLEFVRKSRHARYVQKNPSSLMFRRSVLERTGDWDEVTIGADSEFEERLKVLHDPKAVRYINEVLSFGLDHATSLSKDAVWRGWLSSDLDTYHRSFAFWHAAIACDVNTDSGLQVSPRHADGTRAFPAPARLLRQARPTHFDVVMMSDLRLHGGSVLSVVEEIRAQHAAGMTTAIHQVNCVTEDITGRRMLNTEINQLMHEGACTLIGPDWDIEADLCLMRFPPIFDFAPPRVAKVVTPHHVLAVNTAPVEPNGEGRMYHVDRVIANMTETFGHPGTWYPIGPRIRDYIKGNVPAAILSSTDWVNIVDVENWVVPRTGFLGDRPRVGRHSRDDKVKWPRDAATIRKVYLADPDWEIRVMGGARVVEDLVGPLPGNVTVLGFNAMPVEDFLRGIDFFVYYDDPQRVEAFGRVFIEAIAAGCCVILPPYYRPVFGDACLYAAPDEVRDLVNGLFADPERFVAFVTRAQAIARQRWSYETHVERIRALRLAKAA